MNNLLTVLLMSSPEGGEQNPMAFWIMLGAMFVIFYFFMIRPQTKRAKEAKQFKENLQNGDKVVTIGGIYGKIVELSEKTVILEVEGKVRLKVAKDALIKDASEIISQRK